MFTRNDLGSGEYDPYFESYIKSTSRHHDVLFVLKETLDNHIEVIQNFDKALDFQYENSKWSAAQLITHCIDTERVFNYRALSFMRGDTNNLPGFNQDMFVSAYGDSAFAKASLLKSMITTREATIDLYINATAEMLRREGVANGKSMTVRVIPFVICGHWNHHLSILQDRY